MLLSKSRSSWFSRVAHHRATVVSHTPSYGIAPSFQQRRITTAFDDRMASPSKIVLGVEDTGIVKFKPQNAETAAKTSELLQQNHDNNHILFSSEGFHNHIAHHLLTLYGLGAPAAVIERQYNVNASYQRPQLFAGERALANLTSPDDFKKHLGNTKYYADFLRFFQQEMEQKGWKNVVNEYCFAGDDRADDFLGRMFAGFFHPIIHLGLGIEFNQPAIIAEAMAQAAINTGWTGDFLLAAEKAHNSSKVLSKTLPEIIDLMRADETLVSSVRLDDSNKIRDGILKRAPEEMIKYATQWTVTEAGLEKQTAEMINTVVYFTAAAQRPPKQVKFDFFYIHSVTSSVFWPTFNTMSWISPATKVRLLQWKGYMDLALYVSRGSPQLLLEEIATYVPTKLEAGDGEWKGIFQRFFEFEDDGHGVKLARALKNGEQVCEGYEREDWAKIKDFMWLKVGNMAIDSCEDTGDHWARNVGFEKAWERYEDRPRQARL